LLSSENKRCIVSASSLKGLTIRKQRVNLDVFATLDILADFVLVVVFLFSQSVDVGRTRVLDAIIPMDGTQGVEVMQIVNPY
jgi:hypothetical protein